MSSGSGVEQNIGDSILARSEYGDDGIIPVAMKKWLGRSDIGMNY